MGNFVPDIKLLNNEVNNLSDKFKIRNEQGPRRKISIKTHSPMLMRPPF